MTAFEKRNATTFGRGVMLMLCILLCFLSATEAQITTTIGTGVAGNGNREYPCPLQDNDYGARMQFLYPAAELRQMGMDAGTVNAIVFDVVRLASSSRTRFAVEQMRVKIGTTAITDLGDTDFEPGLTEVYGPVDYLPVLGKNTLMFTTPFVWNGVDNIIVEICNGSSQSAGRVTTANAEIPWTKGLSYKASHTFTDPEMGSLCGKAGWDNIGDQTTRPNISFVWQPLTACSGTPVAGNAVAAVTDVCAGKSFQLYLQNTPVVSNISFQWQVSANNSTFTDIPGATSFNYTTTQSALSYYRAKVSCSTSGAFAYSQSVQIGSPALVSGTAFTINKNAPASATNFPSFADAWNYIKCGINGPVAFTVTSGSGPYNEQLVMDEVFGTSAVNTITFNGNGETLTWAGAENSRGVIQLNGADYVRFNNLVIAATGDNGYGYGVHMLNNADHNTINNCIILTDSTSTDESYAGVVINNSSELMAQAAAYCDSNIISNNNIRGGYAGVVISGGTDKANVGNQVLQNTVAEFYAYGVYFYYNSLASIEKNTIVRYNRENSSYSAVGIQGSDISTRCVINANTITHLVSDNMPVVNAVTGIALSNVAAFSGLDNLVSNNKIYSLGEAVNVSGIVNGGSTWLAYYHNTVSLDGSGVNATENTRLRGFQYGSGSAGVMFKNNIITVTRAGIGSKHAIYAEDGVSGLTADNNDYYIAIAEGKAALGYLNSNIISLAAWQAASSQDAASLNAPPYFVDIETGNLRPVNSAIDNKGVYVSLVPVDIEGLNRSTTTPDPGAYEYTPPACTAPPVAGVATISKDNVCAGTLIALTSKGFSIGAGQTFQWQTAANAAGPYINLGNVLNMPDTTIYAPSISTYYRVVVTCSGNQGSSQEVLLQVKQPLAGGTYTLSQLAPAGTVDFASFQEAKAAMVCGIQDDVVITVIAGSGPYNEQFTLDTLPGAAADATVTFNGNGNVITWSAINSNEQAVIKLNGADHVVFDSLVIAAQLSGYGGYAVQVTNKADSNTFRKCALSVPLDGGYGYVAAVINVEGDEVLPSDGNLFAENTISGGYTCVQVSGAEGRYVQNNRFVNNLVQNFDTYGIAVSNTAGTVVSNNKITRPGKKDVYSFTGITVFAGADNVVVNGNSIYNPFGAAPSSTGEFTGISINGLTIQAGKPLQVTNNLLYNITGSGDLYGIRTYDAPYVHLFHNTVSFDKVAYAGSASSYGIYLDGNAEGNEVKNNIVYITQGGTGNKTGITVNASDITTIQADNNNYYINSAGGNNYTGSYNGSQATLANWQQATGFDAHGLAVNPVFAGAAVGMYKPTVAALNNAGAVVNVAQDIEGVARNVSLPDVGAYEFTMDACTAPPVAGTATVFPASGICKGTEIDLTLNGNSTGAGQTYQWQQSVSGIDNWTNVDTALLYHEMKMGAIRSAYYRCVVTCGTNTAYSTTTQLQLNGGLAAGVYTIDKNGTGNFASFTEAVAAMDCGIEGAVTFLVKAGTYEEQVRMHQVYGASDTSRITFQPEDNTVGSVILTAQADYNNNYVLQLDSASYVTWSKLVIKSADDASYGRVVDIKSNASFDSIVNCQLTGVAPFYYTDDLNVVYINDVSGRNIVLKGNTITNGATGIYVNGSYTTQAGGISIDSNTIVHPYMYGVYANWANSLLVTRNAFSLTCGGFDQVYGVYMQFCDSVYQLKENIVRMHDAAGQATGFYLSYCGTSGIKGQIDNNRIWALQDNSGSITGIDIEGSKRALVRNNVISIATSGFRSYGILDNSSAFSYYNNAVQTQASADDDNYAVCVSGYPIEQGVPVFKNNIIAHQNGGVAMFVSNEGSFGADYNMYYSGGAAVCKIGSAAYNTLPEWTAAVMEDYSSIWYKPAFTDDSTLQPAINDSAVWVMNGRGVQLAESNVDRNNQARPVTLQSGVPDLGAYEFTPAVVPIVATAIPAAPAPNTTQAFMLGSDTVYTITWGNTAPQLLKVRRYSGEKPPSLPATAKYMYYYTDAEVVGAGATGFLATQHYLDSWRGFIEAEPMIRFGRTNAAGTWMVDTASVVNADKNTITRNNTDYLGRFTGLYDSTVRAVADPVAVVPDSSNAGTHFWVGYGHNYYFKATDEVGMVNSQSMVLYLSAKEETDVVVRVNGTPWAKQYHIPANTVITSDEMPKSGTVDARLTAEGKSDRGISIESAKPIVAYAHIYSEQSSGATMLLPTGTYGYEYYALGTQNKFNGADCYSWFYVIANHDSTMVEITPSCATTGGAAANTPFVVMLNKGEVYQVMGAFQGGRANQGYDVTGSKARSLPNASGHCYPIAMFTGNSRTAVTCDDGSGSADNILQQNFPSQAWGKRYLTAPVPNPQDYTLPMTALYRVAVKDTNTVVKRNGAVLTGRVKSYYEFTTDGADYIEADKPVLVAQYMLSTGACGIPSVGAGDPELVYLSPIEQGITQVNFLRNTEQSITVNDLVLIIPDNGVSSLQIDGSSAFDYSYPHPNVPGYTVVVKVWGAAQAQASVSSDVPFTAVTYGLGVFESYGYNAGTLVRNLNAIAGIVNAYDSSGNNSAYACPGTPFRVNVLIPVKPSQINWYFSKAPDLVPNADSVQVNPMAIDSVVISGRTYYRYTVNQQFTVTQPGNSYIPVTFANIEIESCDNTADAVIAVNVKEKPKVDFAINYSGCLSDVAQLDGSAVAGDGVAVANWKWSLGDSTFAYTQQTTKQYADSGTYQVALRVIDGAGCMADTVKSLVVKPYAAIVLVADTVKVCEGESASLAVASPDASAVYSWYREESGGTVLLSGTAYTVNPVTADSVYYVEALQDGCASPRKEGVIMLLSSLPAPVVSVDSITANSVRFSWTEVSDAIGYEVSIDGGATWIEPSSGTMGLVHIVTALRPFQEITLMVKAKGWKACQDALSEKASATTSTDEVFIPNAFSPNGDGLNDVIKVYSMAVKELHLAIFNQWGQKVFETHDVAQGWDGLVNGKPQPSGVYMYVCRAVLTNGNTITKKGSVNLVR
ncbi:gliding motility-associated C-terminal domain-containing protein [Filimonas lacunae]|uniref:Gliding motility-associated C-terminal domain-containing protein n=1 Tax=Filimonas lacunae TaxID=477680 RepID=A0A173M926_9BACT|nr:gliding motility-associated C-terminal domain-containing protein [Filimonas lacunae]BAV04034.1 CHU large protein [Filimonas lacunae]SIT16230.1 gliding motility-associated C-terminal domain-containing protein [Filimonas lacunae]